MLLVEGESFVLCICLPENPVTQRYLGVDLQDLPSLLHDNHTESNVCRRPHVDVDKVELAMKFPPLPGT